MERNIFIGLAWPYVNGDLHIGHLAGYLLPADISARYHRLIGDNVLMVSGSDCFGTPITVEADKKNVSPQDIVNEYHKKDVDLFLNKLKLSYDLYSLTNHPNHIKVTQDIFLKMLEQDLIFIDSSQQYYSPTENRFLPDRYVIGECGYCGYKESRSDQCDNCGKLLTPDELKNPISNISKQPVELKDTQHYYVDWAKLQPKLEEYVNKKSPNWRNWVAQETKGWLNEGLKPRAITRDLDWGIKIPVERMPKDLIVEGHENKRIYVWFDAVIGYLSASMLWAEQNNKDWKPFWYGENIKMYNFMGKDNLVFHTLFWPGQLMSYDPDIHLPDSQPINMYLNLGQNQFSKSRGVMIQIADLVKDYGNDTVRFYLTHIMPETRDSSFSWEDFEEKVNGILVATLGNYIHRVLSLAKTQQTSDVTKNKIWNETNTQISTSFENSTKFLENSEYRNYLNEVIDLARYGNKLVDTYKLWELKKTDEQKFNEICAQLLYIIIALGVLFNPIMFEASGKLFQMLNIKSDIKWNIEYIDSQLENYFKEVILPTDPLALFNKLEIKDIV